MGNIEILIFNNIKNIGGKAALDKAMEVTTDYIKTNRIALGKKTSTREFMTIFDRSLNSGTSY